MKNWLKFLYIIPAFAACNSNNYIIINGTIKVKGSTPHTYLVIEDNKNHTDYQIANSNKFNLQNMQNQKVRIKAKVIKKATGASFPAIVEVLESK